jgi:histidine phosphotransferase ChpT
MPAHPDLSALLGSRLCHDLIGPIGAIGNGVELLLLAGGGRGDEVALISETVTALSARIRFYRVAYGTARHDQSIARTEVATILADLFPSGRITVTWASPPDLPRAEVKATFLLLLCAEQALRSGGKITILRDEVGWSLTLSSPRLRHDVDLWSLIDTATLPVDLEPAQVQFPLAGQALAQIGRRADIEPGAESLRISF